MALLVLKKTVYLSAVEIVHLYNDNMFNLVNRLVYETMIKIIKLAITMCVNSIK